MLLRVARYSHGVLHISNANTSLLFEGLYLNFLSSKLNKTRGNNRRHHIPDRKEHQIPRDIINSSRAKILLRY